MKYCFKNKTEALVTAILLVIQSSLILMSLLSLFCRWYFAILSISGIFSVTFSIVFAYVADVTSDEDRSAAYGLVNEKYCTLASLSSNL